MLAWDAVLLAVLALMCAVLAVLAAVLGWAGLTGPLVVWACVCAAGAGWCIGKDNPR